MGYRACLSCRREGTTSQGGVNPWWSSEGKQCTSQINHDYHHRSHEEAYHSLLLLLLLLGGATDRDTRQHWAPALAREYTPAVNWQYVYSYVAVGRTSYIRKHVSMLVSLRPGLQQATTSTIAVVAQAGYYTASSTTAAAV